jgi:outer membrane murein-binding lipoprotein Lpp
MIKMRRKLMYVGLAALTAATLSAGCMTPAQEKQDNLLRNSRELNNDIRWARYDTAAAHFEAAEGLRFLGRADLVAEELIIADHEMTSIKFDEPPVKAKTVAQFEWYMKNDLVIHKTLVEQSWELMSGTWRITSQRRLRGQRFPLVPEASQKNDAADAGPAVEKP